MNNSGRWRFIRDANSIRYNLKKPGYRDIYDKTKSRADYWITHFSESPHETAGWAHDYVCSCSATLEYHRERPDLHRCPRCGAVAENTEKITQAWQYYRRRDISNGIEAAALTAVVDNDLNARDFVLNAIRWYADNYHSFAEHGGHAGTGKVMGQSLDEAVWCCTLLNALFIIDFDGESDEGKRLYKSLFMPLSQLVIKQTRAIQNIALWHCAAAVGAAVLFRNDALLKQVLNGRHGARAQISEGFSMDGLWFENSPAYHYYALEAATRLVHYLYAGQIREDIFFDRLIKAWTVYERLAFKNGALVSTNDGGNNQTLISKAPAAIAAAWALIPHPDFPLLQAHIAKYYDKSPCMQALLYGIPPSGGQKPENESVLLPSNKMCILRSKGGAADVFCKYGNLSKSHAHPDALSISIYPFCMDVGTSGYGSRLHREWYTKTLSHSTVVVDARDQNREAAGSAMLTKGGCCFTAVVNDAYPGVSISRELLLSGSLLRDTVTVRSNKTHQIDWVFHSSGEACFSGAFSPAVLGEKANGYEWLSDIRRWSGGHLAAQWQKDGRILQLSIGPEELCNAEVYFARSPDNPGNLYRDTILIRKRAKEFSLTACYKITG